MLSFRRLTLLLLLPALLLGGCALRRGQAEQRYKLSAQEAREDVAILHQTFKDNHPSLYWYSRPSLIDSTFTNLIGVLNDSISQQSFYYLVSSAVATLRCGHTSVRPSRQLEKQWLAYRGPVFPVQFLCWNPDTLVVSATLHRNDSVLRRGDRVVGINGRPVSLWIRQFWPFVSADGFTASSRLLSTGNSFGQFYRHIHGLDSVYRFDFLDSAGHLRQHRLRNFVLIPPDSAQARRRDSLARLQPAPVKPNRRLRRLARRRQLVYEVDSATGVSIMRIGSFSARGSRGFYRRSFRRLEKEGQDKLIVDLRSNTGGDISKSNLLLRYLSRQPFTLADSVYAISRRFRDGQYIHPKFFFRIGLWMGTRRDEKGYYHLRHFERHAYQPKHKHHYGGKLLVLQNGYSYSASTLVTHHLRGQPGVLIGGLESGGGDYGNSAIFLPTLVLPNSGLKVSLPLFRMVFHQPGIKGRGVMPDLQWWPRWQSVAAQEDGTMRRALQFMHQP